MLYTKSIYLGKPGEAYASVSGETGEQLARICAPSTEEVVMMLSELRLGQKWSRATLAAVLGVSKAVVRSWETGGRKPSSPSRKLIWLVFRLVTHPKDSTCRWDEIVTWGRVAQGLP
jgi:DNA-binding transcriptional regulator YiaG